MRKKKVETTERSFEAVIETHETLIIRRRYSATTFSNADCQADAPDAVVISDSRNVIGKDGENYVQNKS